MELMGDCNYPYAISICFIVILLFFVAEGTESHGQKKRCTQIVKEERVQYVYKKISVTRKIPARCSSWDRDWAWLTNKDCADRYRVEYMNDKRQIKYTTYRTEHVCCPNENGSWCNISAVDSRKGGEPGYTTETHTLLTVLLPVIATLAFIFIVSTVIIAFVIIRRRRAGNGATSCKHSYESVKGPETKKKGVGKSSSSPPGKDKKLGYEAVGLNECAEKGEACRHLGDIPYSVEVVDDIFVERSPMTSDLLGSGPYEPVEFIKPPIASIESEGPLQEEGALDRFKDIDKDTAIDNALLYNILVEGQSSSSGTVPSAPTYEQVKT